MSLTKKQKLLFTGIGSCSKLVITLPTSLFECSEQSRWPASLDKFVDFMLSIYEVPDSYSVNDAFEFSFLFDFTLRGGPLCEQENATFNNIAILEAIQHLEFMVKGGTIETFPIRESEVFLSFSHKYIKLYCIK